MEGVLHADSELARRPAQHFAHMKVLLLTRYGPQGASSRMRFYQFLPYLESAGFEFITSPLLDDSTLARKYHSGSYGPLDLMAAYGRRIKALWNRHRFDLLWIEKEALPWIPAWFEHVLLKDVPYVLDFDDAIFHNYDQHSSPWIRHFLGDRLDRLMMRSRLVIAGNRYLARRAADGGAPWTEILPTVVDLKRYHAHHYKASAERTIQRLVWIGSPSTIQYMALLAEPLANLARKQPFVLRIIGGGPLSIPNVDIEILPWSHETEAMDIAECDVGIMPLLDTPWEQGKCAYKLIQYMACALPTVASPVGANCEVVVDGKTGFLADKPEAWANKLDQLLQDAELRRCLGNNGRERVRMHYSLDETAPRLVELLRKAGER